MGTLSKILIDDISNVIKNSLDLYAINEMAYSRKSFCNKVHSQSRYLYYTLLNIIMIEDIFQEIYNATSMLIEDKTTEKLSREKIVYSELMEPQMGKKFQDYNVSDYKSAIDLELNKANNTQNKNDILVKKRETEIIKKLVLPHLEDFVKDTNNKKRLSCFYSDLYNAVKLMDINELKRTVNKFSKIGYFNL